MVQLPPALPPDVLRRVCDPNRFDFETTAALPKVQEVPGSRAPWLRWSSA
jgi:hypothetical protein